ncbi:MAG: hypothetical protein FWC41_12370 [Firmicutes bacterium]|nr:hypothetical protein [Bacillota bacterium]
MVKEDIKDEIDKVSGGKGVQLDVVERDGKFKLRLTKEFDKEFDSESAAKDEINKINESKSNKFDKKHRSFCKFSSGFMGFRPKD